MNFRFTLSHDVLGSLEISPPDGWDDAKLKLERDPNFHSLIEYFDGSFIFYGDNGEINGGIDFIRQVESTYGFDADVSILIELTFDGYEYFTVFSGLLKLEAIVELADNKMQIPIIRNDFWSKFINRKDTEVNLQSATDLDGDPVNQFDQINLKLLSQKIKQVSRYLYEPTGLSINDYRYDFPDGVSVKIDDEGTTDDFQVFTQSAVEPIQTEIEDSFNLPFAFVEDTASIFNVIELVSTGGPLRIHGSQQFTMGFQGDLRELTVEADPSMLQYISLVCYIKVKKNNEAPVIIATDFFNIDPIDNAYPIFFFDYDQINLPCDYTIDTVAGDLLYVYTEYNITFVVDVGSDVGSVYWFDRFMYILEYENDINFELQSTFRDTNSFGFLLHDAAGQITDRVIGGNDTFYSEFLGSANTIYRQYDADGCGWKYVLLKGLQLRLYSLIEKPFFLSFMKWWDGANPILNLGLGYEEIEGSEVIRIEEKKHFYDDSGVSLNISNVNDISRSYDQAVIFKTIRIGYKQWQSENISGIDDPQTKQTRATRLQKAGTDITLESEFIAASLAIETTRRKTREKSADYKFDNETFIIAINPIPVDVSPETSPDVNDYSPELDENFSSITNLFNPETRYNSRITPARNFIRWREWLSGCLQKYPDSFFKFTGGEGNYHMISDMSNVSDGCDEYKLALGENQDIAVYDDFFHLPFLFEIVVPMEWEDYQLIRDNRKKAIGISQTDDNHVKFFIKEIEYEITKSRATIRAWPTEDFEIQVIDTVPAMVQCIPSNRFSVDTTLITVDSTEYTADQTEYTI